MDRNPFASDRRGRECARCHRSLRRPAFSPNRATRDGLSSCCKSCHRVVTRSWRSKVREVINARRRRDYRERRDEINELRRAR